MDKEKQNFPNDIDDGSPLPPLADPTLGYIFRSAKAGGLAMHGLANDILQDSGDEPINTIVDMKTQEFQPRGAGCGFRLDILARTAADEVVLLEVQLSKQLSINTRSLVYAMDPLTRNIQRGDEWAMIAGKMPRVISVNILNFDQRKNGKNFHQVIETVYRESPYEIAEKHHQTHNLELPKFRRITPDFTKPLHCWMTAIVRAQDENKTLREVVDMTPELQRFEQSNPPFGQFLNGYEFANADQETRHNFILWNKEEMLQAHERTLQIEESRAEGETIRAFAIAKKMLRRNRPIEEIIEDTGLTPADIESLR
ncbi:MAG: Rpn family recombination-promoting nuclease/putative transposase [Oscillospiraceae bacterium]|nr:Rpn family recombination-promoting nuclease/putative transposase [Oscillospiraceae bacterium]